MPRTDQASLVVDASPERVYAAFVDPDALTSWLPPHGMTARFERFDLRPGGSYRMVLTYWEMVASFITGGVLNKELFFQNGREMLLVWERVRDVLPGIREQQKDALYYGNLEAVAHDFIEYWERRTPGAYQAFSTRIRG